MKSLAPRLSHRLAPGFTLIELLTVIAIIAILMGLLFPAVAAVKETAKKAQAKNDLNQIVVAVKAYYTEYGKYPVEQTGGAPQDAEFLTSNKELFFPLRAIDKPPNGTHKLNPRKVVFIEGKDAKNSNNANKATGGFDDKGDFYDPWGETSGKGGRYKIVIDGNYDGQVDNQYTKNAGQAPKLSTGVIAWSHGRDGDSDKADKRSAKSEDDVISWQ